MLSRALAARGPEAIRVEALAASLQVSKGGFYWHFTDRKTVRDWARRDEEVAERVRGIDDRRMAYLRSLFGGFCADDDDVEAAEHGEKTRSEVLQLAVDRLLGGSEEEDA